MMLAIIVSLGCFGLYVFLRAMGGMGFAILACLAMGYVVWCYQNTSLIMAEQHKAVEIANQEALKRPKPPCDPGWEYAKLAAEAGACQFVQSDSVKRSIRQN